MDDFVRELLSKSGLEEYISKFTDNQIDQSAFRCLTDSDLESLCSGRIGPIAKLRSIIADLRNETIPDELTENLEYLSCSEFLDRTTFWDVERPGAISTTDWETNSGVLIYIDNSNIFINTQQHAARLQKFHHGLKTDNRCRMDTGKLYQRAAGQHEVLEANLYGSEPPLLDTVWTAIRKKKVNVKTHKRSRWTNKEKQIDTSLVADAVEGIMRYRDTAGDNRKVILFTGDKDMLTVVRKAISYGWMVEIWSYKVALSNDLEREAGRNSTRIKIHLIDACFLECTYTIWEWKKPNIPRDRTIVLLLKHAVEESDKVRKIQEVAKVCTAILHIPMVAQFLQHNYEPLRKDAACIPTPTSNRFGDLSRSPSTSSQSYTTLALICFSQTTRLSRRPEDGAATADGAAKTQPLYDFNKDVWAKKDELKKAVAGCCDIITYLQYRQTTAPTSDAAGCIDGQAAAEQDEDESEDDDIDADIDYIVIEKKQKKIRQMYSDFCEYRFRCNQGSKCNYKHSEQEKKFFKEHPNANRRKYKTQFCLYAIKGTCKYSGKQSYLCLFAHDYYECICCNCGEVGLHFADECPQKIH